MFKKIILFIVTIASFLGILLPNFAHAVYFYGQVLQENDIKVVLLGDIHFDTADKMRTLKQTNDLLQEARKYKAHVLAEDPNDNANIEKNSLKISPMTAFCELCRKNNVKATSCEFRTERFCGFYLDKMPKIIATIKSNKALMKNKNIRNYIISIDKEIQHYLLSFNPKNINMDISDDQELYEILTILFELQMLHDLTENISKNKNKTFILCAGQAHIARLSILLQNAFGFKNIITISNEIVDLFVAGAQGLDKSKMIEILKKLPVEQLQQFLQAKGDPQMIRNLLFGLALDQAIDIPALFSYIEKTPERMSKL